MKKKSVLLLPGLFALVLAATPIVASFTNSAVAAPRIAQGTTTPNQSRDGGKLDRLNLTEAQRTQMRQIREAARQRMDAVLTTEQRQLRDTARQNRQRPNFNLSDAQRTQMRQIREEAKRQMDAVLTTEQRQLRDQLRQQRQQSRQQGRTQTRSTQP